MTNKLLIIDDDQSLTELLEEFLTPFSFNVVCKHLPSKGLEALKDGNFDAVVLDIMLPEMNGFKVLKEIRATSNIPVLMLSAKGYVTDRIVGLDAGADDYMAKPFEPRELLARIQSILRRSRGNIADSEVLEFKDLTIDKLRHEIMLDDEQIHLSTTEFSVLLLFAEHPGEILSREYLVEHTRGIKWQSYDRSVDVLVSRLRSKLNEGPNNIRFLKTIHGVGYKFIGEPLH